MSSREDGVVDWKCSKGSRRRRQRRQLLQRIRRPLVLVEVTALSKAARQQDFLMGLHQFTTKRT
jgi:hypothetical protein